MMGHHRRARGYRMNIVIAAVALLALFSSPAQVSASFYRYYDESGVVNVTNDVRSIPERYRANVTVISEKELESRSRPREKQGKPDGGRAVQSQQQQIQQRPSAPNVAVEQPPDAATEKKEPRQSQNGSSWFSRQLPLLKLMGIVALLVSAFVVAGRFVSALAPRPLAIVIKIAMFAALSVYIFKGFAEKAVDAFSKIKEESSIAQKAVDKRSEKIQQQAE